jgi:hypothetical protein
VTADDRVRSITVCAGRSAGAIWRPGRQWRISRCGGRRHEQPGLQRARRRRGRAAKQSTQKRSRDGKNNIFAYRLQRDEFFRGQIYVAASSDGCFILHFLKKLTRQHRDANKKIQAFVSNPQFPRTHSPTGSPSDLDPVGFTLRQRPSIQTPASLHLLRDGTSSVTAKQTTAISLVRCHRLAKS